MSHGHEVMALGGYGGAVIADTDPRTGLDCFAMYVWADAVLTSWTVTNVDDAGDLVGDTLPANSWFFGNITNIELASGKVQLFNSGDA